MKNLSDLNIDDKVYFLKDEPKPYIVKAKGGKYIVATVEDGDYKRHTIIDTEKGICAPHNLTFNPYDFTQQEAVDKCISDLLEGKYGLELSKRHQIDVQTVLNLEKTLSITQ